VVAYDDATGGMAAARLWWLLNWMGHRAAAVLNGVWGAWLRAGLPARSGQEHRTARRFEPHEHRAAYVTAEEILELMDDARYVILDARSEPRYRGEVEPIDPVAGHIPGAVPAPYEENLASDGRFLPPEILRSRFAKLTKSVPPENVICYCGSGVTAAHNILAMAHSGLGRSRLYAGSWSDWITDPRRPVATVSE
jgi:thiosulfate/3-mercaptopyruvate sulfurtransferase